MKQYATYLRVSTQKQGNTQLGLTSQRNMCDMFIKEHKGVLGMEFLDVESGTHRDRKGLWGAINYCQKNNCPLVIATLSRLARDVEFCFKVINTGIEIHFVDMPQINTLLLGVFASVAQYERELTSERTKKALAVKKAQGCKLGASNSIYRKNYNNKTYVEKMEAKRKMGATKCARNLASQEKQAFFKILRRVFPDATQGDIHDWDWTKINSKGKTRPQMLALMESVHDVNPVIFRRFDFSDLESVELQKRLSGYICNLRRAVFKDKDFNETNNQ